MVGGWATPRQAAAEGLDQTPWIMPFDVNQRFADSKRRPISSQSQVYDFMWRTFVALNWPQAPTGDRAEPDTTRNLAPWNDALQSQGPVVWESYRRPDEVFRPPSQWPIFWNDPGRSIDQCPLVDGPRSLLVNAFMTSYSDDSNGLNQPFIQANYPTGPVADQNGNYLRYEVGMNQAFFTYISEFEYYRPSAQVRSVENYVQFVDKTGNQPPAGERRYFQPLPIGTEPYLQGLPDYALQGMVEWKAAWKVLDGDDIPERFYRREVYFLNPDGSCTGPALVGLVGFHIHRTTPDGGQMGATFEQVDNTQLQRQYSSRRVDGAAPLPAHPSLNPDSEPTPDYLNGYEVCDSRGRHCESGVGGRIPTPIKDGEPLSPTPPITNVSRQVAIPEPVQKINAKWRERLEGSVLFYYQMIGAQNRNIDVPNPNLGPGVVGAQASSTNNLINTTLESYTQQGYSCAGCHQNAFPQGVRVPLPPNQQEYDGLRIISFLLQNAVSR
jgi:hypothetical protein